MKILIPNATSPKNTGDQAMLASLLLLIASNMPNATVRVHSVDPALQKKLLQQAEVESSLLSWLMFEKPNFIDRGGRTIAAMLGILFPLLVSNHRLKSILRDYKKSDLIIFAGNGYLRSTKGVTQSILLLLQLIPFILAKRSRKPVIVAPISFGPFAHKWQAKLVAKVLSGISPLYIREEISYALAQKQGLTHAKIAADLALLLPKETSLETHSEYIGVSLRNWYAPRMQARFEKAVIKALITFTKQSKTTVKLFVNVDAPEHKDIDMIVASRVYAALQRAGVRAVKPQILGTYQAAMREYQTCTLLLGMRMHANILSATQHVPFVGIAYEHKTMGIAKTLGVDTYCIWGHDVTAEKLLRLLDSVFNQRVQIQNDLAKSLRNIRASNAQSWRETLIKFR
jgi:colanic acid/amylovoran biosynthesis protein